MPVVMIKIEPGREDSDSQLFNVSKARLKSWNNGSENQRHPDSLRD